MIPYQVSSQGRLGHRLAKVELLLSRDGVSGWQSVGQAEPNLQGFRYYAPEDGSYWFALKTLAAACRSCFTKALMSTAVMRPPGPLPLRW